MALSFLLSPDGSSQSFRKIGSLNAAKEGNTEAFVIRNKDDMGDVPLKVLVELHARVASENEDVEPVKRFANKEEAITTVYPLLRKYSEAGEEVEGGGRGRPSSFKGCTIRRNVAENPRRGDTHGWYAWELIKDGMTWEEYEEAVKKADIQGGTKHARHDWKLGRLTID